MSLDQRKVKILVVEDELHIAEGLKFNLEIKGYDVKVADNGVAALEFWQEWGPELIVLDLMLPLLDGFTFLKKVRQVTEYLPIIVLSARYDTEDKISCFSSGVDDYLTKPFDLDEFFLRIERLLKKAEWIRQEGVARLEAGPQLKSLKALGLLKFGNNQIDFIRSKAFDGSRVIDLTTQEMKLLQVFCSNEGVPVSRKELHHVGLGHQGDINSRTIDNFIVRFRKYFEKDPKSPAHFKSVRSVGYVFEG